MEIPQEDRKPVPFVEEITPRIDEKGLLQPECGHHIIRIYPQGLTREERSAYKTISRVNEQLEQPILRRKAKPSRPKRKRRSRRGPVSGQSTQDPRLAAHQARCSICCHEDRDDIEEEFIRWHSPRNMAEDYSVDARAIYRHAHALNLFALRDRNIRHALGRIIDRADRIPVMTPAAVIRAVHSFVRINSDGQWVETPSHLIVSSGSRPAAAPSS